MVKDHGQPPLYEKHTSPVQPPLPNKGSRTRRVDRAKPKFDWAKVQDLSDAFHFSIAWTLSPPSQELLELTKTSLENDFKGITDVRVGIEEVKAKIGNAVTSISLAKAQVESKALFGF